MPKRTSSPSDSRPIAYKGMRNPNTCTLCRVKEDRPSAGGLGEWACRLGRADRSIASHVCFPCPRLTRCQFCSPTSNPLRHSGAYQYKHKPRRNIPLKEMKSYS
jgi:hypothetical protein